MSFSGPMTCADNTGSKTSQLPLKIYLSRGLTATLTTTTTTKAATTARTDYLLNKSLKANPVQKEREGERVKGHRRGDNNSEDKSDIYS